MMALAGWAIRSRLSHEDAALTLGSVPLWRQPNQLPYPFTPWEHNERHYLQTQQADLHQTAWQSLTLDPPVPKTVGNKFLLCKLHPLMFYSISVNGPRHLPTLTQTSSWWWNQNVSARHRIFDCGWNSANIKDGWMYFCTCLSEC